MTKIHPVGIDLGTTYSAVARIDDAGRTVMVRNSQGDLLTPSVVLFEDREIIVGKDAKKAVGVQNDRVAECVKRDMGSPRYSRPIRGEYLPPEVIQSCILRKLKNDIAAELGPDFKAVITVPAYFDEPRRKATHDAGEMAGLDVLDIVNEPTAAALAYGEHLGYLDPHGSLRKPMKVLVYDLGGGTFDVTVIDLKPGNFLTLATDGDVRLGGRDWDGRMADFVAEQVKKQHRLDPREDAATFARLMRSVEEAKHTLSARGSATIHLEQAGKVSDVTVTRETFEELTEDLLERTAYTSRQVLVSAGLKWPDIDHVLLVGGSTRMPMVVKMLEKLAGRKPEHAVNPDEAVARGAAVFAAYLLASRDDRSPGPRFNVTDVNSHSLGVEGIDQHTLRKENVIIIPRNTPLPRRVSEKFVTRTEGQKSVVVQVLEGESRVPEQCSPVARAVMRKLPPGLPKNWPIEVTYEYRTNGRLSIEAKVQGAANNLKIELEREKGLSDERINKWKRLITAEDGFSAFESMLLEVLNDEEEEEEEDEKDVGRAKKPDAAGAKPGSPESDKPGESGGPKGASPDSTKSGSTAPAQSAASGGGKMAASSGAASNPSGNSNAAAMSESSPDFEELSSGGGKGGGLGASPAMRAAAGITSGTLANSLGPKGGRQAPANDRPNLPTGVGGAGVAPPRQFKLKKKKSDMAMFVALVGHVLAATVGLTLGYYILCLISPSSNFLDIKMPFVPKASDPEIPGRP